MRLKHLVYLPPVIALACTDHVPTAPAHLNEVTRLETSPDAVAMANSTGSDQELTASFANLPATHDGQTSFRFELRFSVEPSDLSYKSVRDGLFDVTNGEITSARRSTKGSNLAFVVTATPSEASDITLSVKGTTDCEAQHAVCTEDGRKLAGGTSATIAMADLVTMTVTDTEVEEAEGATLDFTVTLSRAAAQKIEVWYKTNDGTAKAGADYEAVNSRFTFAPGETTKTISVVVLDDAQEEDSETVKFWLWAFRGVSASQVTDPHAVGTIRDSRPNPELQVGASVDDSSPQEGGSFILSATVTNSDDAASAATTLRYFRSSDATITTADTQIGTDAVGTLAAAGTSDQAVDLTAPSAAGTYYYGACVDSVSNETDTSNNCSSAVAVKPNHAPRPGGTIPDEGMAQNNEVSVDVAPFFTDPDGDELTYTAESSDTAVASVSVSESTVTVAGVAQGVATVTVTATDPGNLSATQSLSVTVVPNRRPVVTGVIEDVFLTPGERHRAQLPDVFTDPDGDSLTWTTSSSDSAVAEATISRDEITLQAVAVGTATVSVTATDPGGLSVTDEVEVEVTAERFDIQLHFKSSMLPRWKARKQIKAARSRWEQILAATEFADVNFDDSIECNGAPVASVETVDDLLIIVEVRNFAGRPGTLAYATLCHVRETGGTPIVCTVVFNWEVLDDLMQTGELEHLASHEFGHCLGFYDSHFRRRGVISNNGGDAHFTGQLAIEAFDAAGGRDYQANKVPTSSDFQHWRESVFGSENMSALFVSGEAQQLSAITLQAMADMGYTVNLSFADDYELPGSVGADSSADREMFDLSGDVVWGPVKVLDADGRTVRVIPPPSANGTSARRR